MDKGTQINDTHSSYEQKLVKAFISISIVAHIVLLIADPLSWFTSSQQEESEPEWVFETELISDIVSRTNSTLDPRNPKKVLPEDKGTKQPLLPQLPKKFAIKDKEIFREGTATEAQAPSPDAEGEVAKKSAKPEKKDPKINKHKLDKEATKLYKKDLMARLLKEQKRQEMVEHKKRLKEESKRQNKVAQLRKKIEANAQQDSNTSALAYIAILEKYIKNNYSIPAIYNIDQAQVLWISLVFDARGHLTQSKISKSSNNLAFDRFALGLIEQAAPNLPKILPKPMPKELVGREIRIRFNTKHM